MRGWSHCLPLTHRKAVVSPPPPPHSSILRSSLSKARNKKWACICPLLHQFYIAGYPLICYSIRQHHLDSLSIPLLSLSHPSAHISLTIWQEGGEEGFNIFRQIWHKAGCSADSNRRVPGEKQTMHLYLTLSVVSPVRNVSVQEPNFPFKYPLLVRLLNGRTFFYCNFVLPFLQETHDDMYYPLPITCVRVYMIDLAYPVSGAWFSVWSWVHWQALPGYF